VQWRLLNDEEDFGNLSLARNLFDYLKRLEIYFVGQPVSYIILE